MTGNRSTLELAMHAQLDQARDLPPFVEEHEFDRRTEKCRRCQGEGRIEGVHRTKKCTGKGCNGGQVRTGRRWRFDFAWPDRLVALEVDGGTHSGGRHVTGAGIEGDSEKFSEAAVLGWRIIRACRVHVMNGDALEWVRRALAMGGDHDLS